MDALFRDIRYGFRLLLRTPAVTIAAVLSLALGVGANTTVFTIINALFLNPLPVDRPAELVAINTLDTKNTTQFGNVLPLSYPNFADLRDGTREAFGGFAGYGSLSGLAMTSDTAAPEPIFSQLVTANFFDVLGLRPAAGRFFLADEDRTTGTHPVVVLNHGFWQRRFGGRADVVGQTVRLNTIDFTIVGVAPREFLGLGSMVGPDVWLPSMMAPLVSTTQSAKLLTDRSALSFSAAARLAPGVTMAQAQARLATIAQSLERAYPKENVGRGVSVLPLTEATIFPGMRQGLWLGGLVLMAVVGLVLLIACSNVANLLLARASTRRQELAVRLALGAGRGRLMRQLLTESILLSLAGGALGVAFGVWGRNILWAFRPVVNNFMELPIDWRVLAYGIVLSLLTGVIFGVMPAWHVSRAPLGDAIKDARASGQAARGGAVRSALLVGQMALSLVALVAAALFLRSIQQAYAIDPGFDASRLAVLSVTPQQARYDRPRTEQFYRDARQRLSTVSGIESVSWAAQLPLWAKQYRRLSIEGQAQQDGTTAVLTLVNTIDARYFATLGVPVRRGREFDANDRDDTRPVAIVNDTMAAKSWPGQDPIGRHVRFDDEPTTREIVGVVGTTKYQTLGEAPQACAFVPLAQQYTDAMVLYVRTTSDRDPAHMLGTVQKELRAIGADVPVGYSSVVSTLLTNSLWMVKFGVGLLAVFGLLALGLAAVGVYGVMAYAVSQRTREIGLRIALGADPAVVRGLVWRQAMRLVAIALVLGLAGAVLIGRAMSSLLYGLSSTDPLSLIGATLTLIAVAAIASYLPARRASKIDPAISLREA